MTEHARQIQKRIEKPFGGQMSYAEICSLENYQLEEMFKGGIQPDPKDLTGYEFDGFNTMDVTPLLGIRRFQKGFFQDSKLEKGELGGYNVAITPGRIVDPWTPIKKKGKTHRHSFFRVYPVRQGEIDNLYPNAVLINYDTPRNEFWNPGFLRDYLVQIFPGNKDLFLGKAYVALGKARIFVSYFVLIRAAQPQDLDFV